ncbi:hypothetical protein [Spiroplasma endosymbiont of Ammophila pubescens]|uniref:hypothetical protein n=1 Tax=Spiroplasma endosymbiont of Ammophila pubescens TaxID=3066315 RepID=UPI0032B27CCE
MFSRLTKDITFYLKREEWKFALNEDNFKYKPRFVLDRYQKKIGTENFRNFKYWIFKRWILKNFAYTQDFIHRFYKYQRKLDLVLTGREQEFIYNVEEVNFTLWRPLKVLPVAFDLQPKEKCHFKNNTVNIHLFTTHKDIKFFCKGVLLITNKRFIIDGLDKNNNKKVVQFNLTDISNVEFIDIGVKITVGKQTYLIRENNHMLILALLYRCLGHKKVTFDLKKLPLNFKF